jgi:anti-sigma factor RsiW
MAFFDGELSASDAQAVAAHLDGCSECSTFAAQLRGLSQSLTGWSVPPVQQKLEEAVKDFAAKAGAKNKSRKPAASFSLSIWNWKLWAFGGMSAVAGVFLFVGIVSLNTIPSYRRNGKPMQMAMMGQSRSEKTGGYAAPQSLRNQMNNSLAASSRTVTRAPGGGTFVAGMAGGPSDFGLNSPAPAAPMIARTASLSITVKDLTAARASLDAILARHQGYSAELTVESAAHAPRSLTASLRIPAPKLSAALADLKTLGRVEKESQSGEDVSQQHADLAERLKTARETEERFRGILQRRAGNISDVLEVEESIARVRGEIESMEAEQTALDHRVDFATIDLQLSEVYKEEISSPSSSFSLRFHNAFVAGYRNAAETLVGIVLFFVEYGLSILIWLAILMLPVVLLWRRYRKARSTM